MCAGAKAVRSTEVDIEVYVRSTACPLPMWSHHDGIWTTLYNSLINLSLAVTMAPLNLCYCMKVSGFDGAETRVIVPIVQPPRGSHVR
jgi:hypothetical protein